jgi:cytochrome b561
MLLGHCWMPEDAISYHLTGSLPVYNGKALRAAQACVANPMAWRNALMAEWAGVWQNGPGVLVVQGLYADVAALALAITALMALGSKGHPLTLLGNSRMDQFPVVAESALATLLDWGDVHKFLGDAQIWLAGLHAFADAYHGFVQKDGVLKSMLPYPWLRK